MDKAQGADAAQPKKVWTTLITNLDYLPGLLTLDFSLKKSKTAYPLIALYTEAFPDTGLQALKARGIPARKIGYLVPSVKKDYSNDPRFYDCWSKLTPFSLTEYDRVVQLDSDMLVLQNMDELMDLELDPPSAQGKGQRVFACSHACVCNPLKKAHYPKDWVPENCAFTSQHNSPEDAQEHGAPSDFGFGMPNGGLQVVNPSSEVYNLIAAQMDREDVMQYDFADQSLLGDVFKGRWVALPYIYNALKTLRWKGVHNQIWQDKRVKNVHYILSPKPWDEKPEEARDESHEWWHAMNAERIQSERDRSINDGF